ncbi:hypothetical protein LTR94_038106, partial [Friedmanniomyces endolithicus]
AGQGAKRSGQAGRRPEAPGRRRLQRRQGQVAGAVRQGHGRRRSPGRKSAGRLSPQGARSGRRRPQQAPADDPVGRG